MILFLFPFFFVPFRSSRRKSVDTIESTRTRRIVASAGGAPSKSEDSLTRGLGGICVVTTSQFQPQIAKKEETRSKSDAHSSRARLFFPDRNPSRSKEIKLNPSSRKSETILLRFSDDKKSSISFSGSSIRTVFGASILARQVETPKLLTASSAFSTSRTISLESGIL